MIAAMPTSPARAVLAGLFATAACVIAPGVQAQGGIGQSLAAQGTLEPDVLSFFASQSLHHESNLLRLPSGLSAAAATGGAATSRSDIVSTTTLGARFMREFSLQRVRADAAFHLTRFRDNDVFDSNGYDAGAAWDWAYGRQWYGTASVRADRRLASFDDVRSGERNDISTEFLGLQAGYRFTPSWSALGGLDLRVRSNSATRFEGLDNRITGIEGGARWEPRSGADWRFLWRHAEGRYPNRQVFDALGNLLPVTIDNAYSEDRVYTRLGIEPSDKTRVQADIGYTSRRFENLSQRDFGGITFGVDYTWRGSDVFHVTPYARRDIGSAESLTASWVDTRRIGVTAMMLLGGRTQLNLQTEYRREDYSGDPGFVLLALDSRDDRVAVVGATIRYELARRIWLSLLARYERRNSNFAQFDFSARTIGVTAEIVF